MQPVWKKLKIKYKNLGLNRNIRRFAAQHAAAVLPERETELRPEIIIPCYNHGRYIEKALTSIKGQWPTTIVNDASTDDSLQIIEGLRSSFSFKLINNEKNLNYAGSLNRAISESDNNLFIMLNADDYLLPYSLAMVMDIFAQHQQVRMAGGGSLLFSDEAALRWCANLPNQLNYRPKLQWFTPAQALKIKRMNDLNMTASGSAFLRSAWQAVGGFAEFKQRVCSYDDRDFEIKVACLFGAAIFQEPTAMYRVDSGIGAGQL